MALLPSVVNICKKFGARPGLLQNVRPDLNQYLLDKLIDYVKKKFKKLISKINLKMEKNNQRYPACRMLSFRIYFN